MRRGRRGAAAAVLAAPLAACAHVGRDAAALHALCARRLMVPVSGVRPAEVPDTFEASRGIGFRRHRALDIPAARGTPVVSADDGVVLALRENRRGGRTVYATDPDRRFVYYYAHLDHYRPWLRHGEALVRGDVLGAVGTTGNADRDWPHLHFQVMGFPADGRWWDGTPIDPRSCFALEGRERE